MAAHGEADGVLRGRLRDHDDVASSLFHRLEHRVGGARDADHAGSLDVDDRDVLDRREAFDEVDSVGIDVDGVHRAVGISGHLALVADARAGRRLVEVVPEDHRDVVTHRRKCGARVQHVGAKVRQLPRLVVRQRFEANRLLNLARIGGVHAVDVGPDGDRLGDEHGAEDGGGVVGAVALERRRDARG